MHGEHKGQQAVTAQCLHLHRLALNPILQDGNDHFHRTLVFQRPTPEFFSLYTIEIVCQQTRPQSHRALVESARMDCSRHTNTITLPDLQQMPVEKM